MRLTNIGYGNMIATGRIIAIVNPDAAPVRRLVTDARDAGKVVDATCGHKTRSVIITDSEHVILSPLVPETLAGRVDDRNRDKEVEEE